ncbi:aldose 1-epimerase [Chitinophaga pendula]|uniref:aldose 1-epimerase n=1 Tax=Chitinophaga TaxID=79328 RepID=UPI000BAFF352|nr:MULTISPECIES: aldose 1-epimerase [Chitinophaga]ASZ11528.1 hypothetical protein CK934_11460 [Chitinophaga sp. MD30]UCJ05460.1 aldose 1-epimerase [Chitinophaga pendula]
MFRIDVLQQDGFDIVRLSDGGWQQEEITVDIVPSHGALLHAFSVPYGSNGRINVIDSYRDATDLQQHFTESFKGVKLSPFACRIPDGKYAWGGKEWQIQRAAVPGVCLHGLLYNAVFKMVDHYVGESEAAVTLLYAYEGDDVGYPFAYDCKVVYRLLADRMLEIKTTVFNKAEVTIPVMDGWHPYFTTGSLVDELELQFPSEALVVFNEQMVPSGELIPYQEFTTLKKIGALSLDNSFIIDRQASEKTVCVLNDPKRGVRIDIWPDESYPILQLYIPPHRQSIAIENLSGAPNAFNNGMGVVEVRPGEQADFATRVQVNAIWGDFGV